jgi:hypothetical protein
LVTEIGAYAGDLTGDLADWAEGRGGQVVAIDPFPQPALSDLAEQRESVELIREPSEEALVQAPRTDAVVIDGDHNYYTVSRELRTIADCFADETLPLLLLHDVRWPHARRDAYYSPESIPSGERHEYANGAVFPGVSQLVEGGLRYRDVATHEGGPGNGVLTALEDFLAEHEALRFAIVPAFFGLAVVWPADAKWGPELERLLAPWDRNPWLERLEWHRVYNLARLSRDGHVLQEEIDRLRQVDRRKAEWMQRLAESRVFQVAERISSLRDRGQGRTWRQQLQTLVDER